MHQTASSSSLSISHLRLQLPTPTAGAMLLDAFKAPSTPGFDTLLTRPTRPSSASTADAGSESPPPTASDDAAKEADRTSNSTTEEANGERIDKETPREELLAPLVSQTPQTAVASQLSIEDAAQPNGLDPDAEAVMSEDHAAPHDHAIEAVVSDEQAVPPVTSAPAEYTSEAFLGDGQAESSVKSPPEIATGNAAQSPSASPLSTLQATVASSEVTGMTDQPDAKSVRRSSRTARTSVSGSSNRGQAGSPEAATAERLPAVEAADTLGAAQVEPILTIDPSHPSTLSDAVIGEADAMSADAKTADSPLANAASTGTLSPNVTAQTASDAITTAPAPSGGANHSANSNMSRGTAAGAAAEAPGTTGAGQQSRLVDRVMRGIEQLQGGATQVRVRLHPPQLGSLQMSLRIEQSRMQLELVVESAAARDAVRNRMQELEGRLAEQGLELQKVEIKVAGQQTASNGQETPNGSPQHHFDSPDRGSERPQAPARHSDDNPLSTELTPLSRPLLSNQPALSIDIRA